MMLFLPAFTILWCFFGHGVVHYSYKAGISNTTVCRYLALAHAMDDRALLSAAEGDALVAAGETELHVTNTSAKKW